MDAARPHFATTRWSVVVAGGGQPGPVAREALAFLCEAYWPPLHAFALRRTGDPERARDLTQEFFAVLLEKGYVGDADRARGRFRTFLLASFRHFLANEADKERALKRGEGRAQLNVEGSEEGASRVAELATHETPGRHFDRQWALTLLARVLDQLREEQREAGKETEFDALKVFLTGEAGAPPYAEVALTLGTTEGAARVAVYHLRRRYGTLLRNEIAQTVATPGDVEEELRDMFAALGP